MGVGIGTEVGYSFGWWRCSSREVNCRDCIYVNVGVVNNDTSMVTYVCSRRELELTM
ncbi:hypothetical protein LINPERPRIM_LOCUS20715 [Linum perenne]